MFVILRGEITLLFKLKWKRKSVTEHKNIDDGFSNHFKFILTHLLRLLLDLIPTLYLRRLSVPLKSAGL
jgi:hypothetical protein